MCGLVGVVAKNLWKGHVDAFNDLLWIDQVRGRHSTGVAAIHGHKRDEIRLIKDAVRPDILQDLRRYDTVVSHNAHALIGHNRYATVGAINSANAHPFVFPTLVGAQNGTIPHGAFKSFGDVLGDESFGTDTETLYYLIDKLGVEAVIPKVWGAWALTWYDREEKTLNFLRNKERPLYIALLKNKQALFWASEKAMLDFALERQAQFANIGYTIYTISEDTHYVVDVDSNAKDIELVSSPLAGGSPPLAPIRTPLIGHNSDPYHGYAGYGNNVTPIHTNLGQSALPFRPDGDESKATEAAEKTTATAQSNARAARERPAGPVLRGGLLKGFKGEYIDKETFHKLTKRGCEWLAPGCLVHVEFSDVKNGRTPIHWIARDQFLCTVCKEDPSTKEYLRCY